MRKLLLNPTPLFRKLRQLSMLLSLLLTLPAGLWAQGTKTFNFYGATDNIIYCRDENNFELSWTYQTFQSGYYGASTVDTGVKITVRDNHGKSLLSAPDGNIYSSLVDKISINYSDLTVTEGSKIYLIAVNRTDTTTHYSDPCLMTNSGTLEIDFASDEIRSENLALLIFSNDNKAYSYILNSITFTLIDYKISIAGVALTGKNVGVDGSVTGVAGISGNVSYDATTNTLTLNGATINGGIVYSGAENLTIALKGTNSINNTNGLAIDTQTATSASGTIEITKASDASSAELTATGGSNSSPIVSSTTLGTGLYWKPTAQNIMVITEDPEFIIIDDLIMTDNRTVSGDNSTGTITYSASNKTLTIDGFQKNFGANHAIKTGVSGLKVKLIGASTINCSANSAVFYAFSSSASIQFIKDDATSKLTMTGTDFENFATNSITYDGLFHYSDNTNKIITQAAAPVLSKQIKNDGSNNSYTYVTIDYAASDKSGSDAIYAAANPELRYSFDYADPQKKDVSDQAYPTGGIKMTDPGILTAWVEVSNLKSPESKGVRFGFIENPFKMEFNGTAKQISITPAPTMTNAVTPSVSSDYSGLFNSFATLDAANKITIKSCYDGKIGFIFDNGDGYTSLNDSTLVTFKITPPKPTISVPGGTYDAAQTVSIVSNYQGTGATIKYYFESTAAQTYSADLSITTTQTLTAWVEVNGVKSDTVQAPYTIRQAANLSYSATTATAKIQAGGTTFTAPTLDNPLGINGITYSSSNEQVATINNTGDVTILGAGTTTISAKATDETIYTPTPASYVLTVTRNIINPFSNVMEGQNFATYYNHNEDLALPEGLTAYIVTGVSGTTVIITATGYLPKDVPLLLEKTGELAESLEMNGYSGETGNFSSNKLRYVSSEAGETASGDQYVLYMNEFVKATGTIPQWKCYLDLNGVAPSRGMYGIGNDGSTGIEGITPDRTNGEGEWYDLQGRRIQQPTKAGIYIVNGKKVIINKK